MSVESARAEALRVLHEAALPESADGAWIRRVIAAQLEEESDRAVEIVLGLADARGLRALPALRGDLVLWLCGTTGRATAVNALIERYGYVSTEPAAFVRMQMERDQWPTGF